MKVCVDDAGDEEREIEGDGNNRDMKIIGIKCSMFFLKNRRPPKTTTLYSSAAAKVYKRQG